MILDSWGLGLVVFRGDLLMIVVGHGVVVEDLFWC